MSGMITSVRSSNPVKNNYWLRWGVTDDRWIPYGEGSEYGGNPIMANPDTQETTSFRTTGGSADDEDQEIADARRIFRNGFTSYDPAYDHGHEFFTTKTSTVASHPWWEAVDNLAFWNQPQSSGWRGPLIVTGPDGNLPSAPGLRRISSDDVRSFGQRAIQGSSPTAPQASITTLLGEVLLDGGLPYLGSKAARPSVDRRSASDAGSDYLNAQFGWIPLVSDTKKLVQSLLKANANIKQLVKDSGRNVRRSFSFPTITEHTEQRWTNAAHAWYNIPTDTSTVVVLNGSEWQLTKLSSRKRDIWFKGSFTYHIAVGDDVMNRLERYEQLGNKLLGSRLNASALWELAPWSWLIDWQANIGNALGVASMLSEDGLVIRYGYLMCHTVDEDIYTTSGLGFKSGGLDHSTTIYRRETKERVRATPFGFGLDLEALSPKQWSILAALGMTKGSNALRLTS